MRRTSVLKATLYVRSIVLDFRCRLPMSNSNKWNGQQCLRGKRNSEDERINSVDISARTLSYYQYYKPNTVNVFSMDPVFITDVENTCTVNRVAKLTGTPKITSNRRQTLNGNFMKSDLHKSVNDVQSRGNNCIHLTYCD